MMIFSELISDEYLLTNDSENENNIFPDNDRIHDDNNNDDFNKAAALIFST